MTNDASNRNDWPAYSYVPGGPFPHPVSDPSGHSFGHRDSSSMPIVDDNWQNCSSFLEGIDLFNHGYYWESHEAWETQWHAEGRKGPHADVLRALIKLGAAGVKVREGQPGGVTTHASRARDLLLEVAKTRPKLLGLSLTKIAAFADQIAKQPPASPVERHVPVAVVFDFRLEPK